MGLNRELPKYLKNTLFSKVVSADFDKGYPKSSLNHFIIESYIRKGCKVFVLNASEEVKGWGGEKVYYTSNPSAIATFLAKVKANPTSYENSLITLHWDSEPNTVIKCLMETLLAMDTSLKFLLAGRPWWDGAVAKNVSCTVTHNARSNSIIDIQGKIEHIDGDVTYYEGIDSFFSLYTKYLYLYLHSGDVKNTHIMYDTDDSRNAILEDFVEDLNFRGYSVLLYSESKSSLPSFPEYPPVREIFYDQIGSCKELEDGYVCLIMIGSTPLLVSEIKEKLRKSLKAPNCEFNLMLFEEHSYGVKPYCNLFDATLTKVPESEVERELWNSPVEKGELEINNTWRYEILSAESAIHLSITK